MDMILTIIRVIIFLAPASIFFGGFWAGLIMMLTDPYGKSGKIAFFGGFTVGGILLIIQWAMMAKTAHVVGSVAYLEEMANMRSIVL